MTDREFSAPDPSLPDDQYLTLVRESPQPMWVYDVETLAFLDVNDAATRHYGYTRDEFLAMTLADIRPPEDVPALRASVAAHADRASESSVWRHRTKTGALIEVRVSSRPLEFAGRRAKVVLARDVTAMRTADEERRRREHTDRAITDLANALIHAPADRIDREIERGLATVGQLVGAEMAYVFRVSADRQEGFLTHDWRAPAAPAELANLGSVPLNGWPWAIRRLEANQAVSLRALDELPPEAAVDRASWTVFGLQSVLTLPLLEEGALAGWLGFATFTGEKPWSAKDIESLERLRTALGNALRRQAADRALRESEAQYRQLVEHAPIGIGVADGDGNLLTFNAAMLKPGGYTAEDIRALGGNVAALYYDPTERHAALAKFQRDGTLLEFPVRFRRKDGTPYDALLSLTPVRFRGQPCVQAIVVDVSERRRAADALRASEERLRQAQKLEAIGQLAGGVAHDFNNLLTVIQGNTSLLLGRIQEDERAVGDLQEIAAAADRAAALTRQLLAVGRRQVKQARDLDLGAVMQATGELLARLLGEDIRLEVRVAPDAPWVHADPGMMEQVLMNLAVNARDALPRGGRLTMRLDAVEVGDEVRATQPLAHVGPAARLTIRDTGSGIRPEHLPHIFEPFFTTKDVGKGSGLGLATVFGIVQQHDGWIEVDSAVGRGTEFRIFLPAVTPGAAAIGSRTTVGPQPGRGETILVVEDEPAVRRLARSILERHGYSVLDAGSGAEALGLWEVQGGGVDLLLTDFVMPGGMTGRDLATELRRRHAALKVLYTSGYSREMVQHGLEDGNSQFLPKPYDMVDLAAAVRRCLDGDA